LAPSLASASAIPNPIPLVEPVTNAVLPESSNCDIFKTFVKKNKKLVTL
jgi:hypothetical protein